MATFYVSKTTGNNSNNGTSKTTPVADLWRGFELAVGDNNTIEVIDSSVYYATTASMNYAYPGDATTPNFKGMTVKAGTHPTTGIETKPTLSGKITNESGSVSAKAAFQYQQGWTIEGFEIRDYVNAAAEPAATSDHATYGKCTLVIKNCLIHHIQDRNTLGQSEGAVSYKNGNFGDETTNVVESCIFYEIGHTVVGGNCQEDVAVRNCLVSNWGGNGTGNNKCIYLNATGSIVEHCIVSDYENKNTGTTPIHLNGKGTVRHTIVNKLTGDSTNGIIYADTINNCMAHLCTSPGSGSEPTTGNFSAGPTVDGVVKLNDCTNDPTLEWNSGSDSNGYFDSGRNGITSEEIGNFLKRGGSPPFSFTTGMEDGPNQASGSSVTYDLGNIKWLRDIYGYERDRVRSSTAGGCAADIGCYQYYKEYSDQSLVTNPNISANFTINDAAADQLNKQFSVRQDHKSCSDNPRPPFSKTVKGPGGLRKIGSKTPYKLTKG